MKKSLIISSLIFIFSVLCTGCGSMTLYEEPYSEVFITPTPTYYVSVRPPYTYYFRPTPPPPPRPVYRPAPRPQKPTPPPPKPNNSNGRKPSGGKSNGGRR